MLEDMRKRMGSGDPPGLQNRRSAPSRCRGFVRLAPASATFIAASYPGGSRLLLWLRRNQRPVETARNLERWKSVYMLMLIRTFLLAVAAFVAVVSAVFSPVQRR